MTRRCHVIAALSANADQLELIPLHDESCAIEGATHEAMRPRRTERHAESEWRDTVEKYPLTPFAKQSIRDLRAFADKLKRGR